jgi:CheY-like chemotaxis protein
VYRQGIRHKNSLHIAVRHAHLAFDVEPTCWNPSILTYMNTNVTTTDISDINPYLFSNGDDDFIYFLDEDIDQLIPIKNQTPWKILVADDDVNVHDTTLLALNGVLIHGRPLEFLHAYSAAQAHQVLTDNRDTALVLLDVVMETIDAGLKLVEIIRNEMGDHDLRIILRTGQPGYALEKRLNNDFAIDGYTTKSKLTRSMLISVLSDTLDSDTDQEN